MLNLLVRHALEVVLLGKILCEHAIGAVLLSGIGMSEVKVGLESLSDLFMRGEFFAISGVEA